MKLRGKFWNKPIKLSNRRLRLLTKEFMVEMLKNLNEEFGEETLRMSGIHNHEGTNGFYKAFKKTCVSFNVKKALYDFFEKQPWYVSDIYEAQMINLLYTYGIVPESTLYGTDEFSESKYEKQRKQLMGKQESEDDSRSNETNTIAVKHKEYTVYTTEEW